MQHISIGDLVERKTDGRLGVVVDAKPPNEGLSSEHVRHLRTLYHDVYYVLFSEEGKKGPFHVTELNLKQSCITKRPTHAR